MTNRTSSGRRPTITDTPQHQALGSAWIVIGIGVLVGAMYALSHDQPRTSVLGLVLIGLGGIAQGATTYVDPHPHKSRRVMMAKAIAMLGFGLCGFGWNR